MQGIVWLPTVPPGPSDYCAVQSLNIWVIGFLQDKIQYFFIDFHKKVLYDILAKYGMLYFVGIACKYGISQRKYYERGFKYYGKS